MIQEDNLRKTMLLFSKIKTQVYEQEEASNLKSTSFRSSITQGSMVATQKFHKDWKKLGITCMQVMFKE